MVVAYKNKMDLAIGVAIGSSMQIALFVTPFLVILGWIINQPMNLSISLLAFILMVLVDFEIFQVAVIFVSVVMTNYLIMDGKSNWMEGVMLLGVYIIVAIAYWLYPDDSTTNGIPHVV